MADVTDCPGCGRRLPWGARRGRECGSTADALTGAGHSGDAPGPTSGAETVSVDVPLPASPPAAGPPAEWAFLVDGTVAVPHRTGLWLLGPDASSDAPWTTVDAPGGPTADWWPVASDVLVMSDADGQGAVPVLATGYGDPVALPGWSEVVGLLGDDVVVNTPDGAYGLAADGSVRRVADGRVAGVARDRLLVRSCDDVGRCTVAITIGGGDRTVPLWSTDLAGSHLFRGVIGPAGDRALVLTQEPQGDGTMWWMQAGLDPVAFPFAGWGGPAASMAFGAGGTVAVWHDGATGRIRVGTADGATGSIPWPSPLLDLVLTAELPVLVRPVPIGEP